MGSRGVSSTIITFLGAVDSTNFGAVDITTDSTLCALGLPNCLGHELGRKMLGLREFGRSGR
jgi:hypothetical protein